jgi:hypothetical protein
VRALREERELRRALGVEGDIQTTALASHMPTVARSDTKRLLGTTVETLRESA